MTLEVAANVMVCVKSQSSNIALSSSCYSMQQSIVDQVNLN